MLRKTSHVKLLLDIAYKYKNWNKVAAIFNKINKEVKLTPAQCRREVEEFSFHTNNIRIEKLIEVYRAYPAQWNKICSALGVKNVTAAQCFSLYYKLIKKMSTRQ